MPLPELSSGTSWLSAKLMELFNMVLKLGGGVLPIARFAIKLTSLSLQQVFN
jgi:hypothetical protein